MPAIGPITARYFVAFRVFDGAVRTLTVALSEGYTEFEDIRKIISIRFGVKPTDIKVVAIHELDLTPEG